MFALLESLLVKAAIGKEAEPGTGLEADMLSSLRAPPCSRADRVSEVLGWKLERLGTELKRYGDNVGLGPKFPVQPPSPREPCVQYRRWSLC